jgi:hypothetical protein
LFRITQPSAWWTVAVVGPSIRASVSVAMVGSSF